MYAASPKLTGVSMDSKPGRPASLRSALSRLIQPFRNTPRLRLPFRKAPIERLASLTVDRDGRANVADSDCAFRARAEVAINEATDTGLQEAHGATDSHVDGGVELHEIQRRIQQVATGRNPVVSSIDSLQLCFVDLRHVSRGHGLPCPPAVIDLLRDALVGATTRVVRVIDEAALPTQHESQRCIHCRGRHGQSSVRNEYAAPRIA